MCGKYITLLFLIKEKASKALFKELQVEMYNEKV